MNTFIVGAYSCIVGLLLGTLYGIFDKGWYATLFFVAMLFISILFYESNQTHLKGRKH